MGLIVFLADFIQFIIYASIFAIFYKIYEYFKRG